METLDHESCIQEVDTLKAIFEDDLQIEETESGRPECLTIKILPATGDDRSKQYVCLTLQLRLPPAYPLEPPEISVKNPRGLSDEEISSLLEDMRSLAIEQSGSPVLYEIIEMAKDCLTEGNIPHCPCAICLDHFVEGDVFTKTDCYHYFHKACLWSYYQHAQRQAEEANIEAVAHQQEPQPFKLLCPTCRFELGEVDEDDLESAPPPIGGKEVSALTPEVRQRQAEMAERFREQQKKGGVIDLEAERSKYLVSADTVVVINHNPNPKNFTPSGKQRDAAKENQDNQTVKPPQDPPCRGSTRGPQYSTGHDNRGQGTSDHDLRGQDSSGYGSRGQDSRSHEGKGQDYRGQDNRTRENRSHANRNQDHRSHGNRRNWRGSGYYDEDYDQGNRDHYYERRDGNSARWQDDQARPQGRWNNRNNRYKMPERNGEVHQAFDCRQSLDSRMKEGDGMHPKVIKENMREDDRNKEENPSASRSQEERGEHRSEDGRGSGRNHRNRRNRQHRPHDRQETDPQQERPNSGGKHGNANRNRNRPTHSEQKQGGQSVKNVEVEPTKKDDASSQSEPKRDADTSKEGTSPRAESGQEPSGGNDGSQEGKPRGQGHRHRRRGGRRNRRTSECDDDPHNHHTESDRDHERKSHPREFRGRKSSDAQETDSAQARDGDDEGKSKRREQRERRRGGRGNQEARQSYEKSQYQDSREGEKESQAKVQYHRREMEGGQRHQKTRDGRGSHQGNEDHQLHHRHEYYGRGRGHYRHRESRDFDDYHDDGMVHGRGQDERGSEIRDHRGKENRRDQGIDGRGRGYYRRDYGRRRGESYTKHENDKVSPRENASTEPNACERKENTEKNRGAGSGLHAEKSSEKGISEPAGEPSTALPSSAGVESADSQLRRPPGFTATAAPAEAGASGVRPPPGFRGKSTVSPPPGFSKLPSSSAD